MNIYELEKLRKNVNEEIGEMQKEIKNARLDMSLGELASMYTEGDLIIRPEFQRLFRWDEYQKTRLLETILVGLPMPSIFVVEDKEGRWELIDGLQRLSTVFSFLGKLKNQDQGETKDHNNWKMGEGDILKQIKGWAYEDLPPRAKNLIRRYICRVEIIYYGSDFDVRYEIFERLNTGGSPLSDQEIRNAIYRTESEDFNKFLTRNGKDNNEFLDLIRISNNQKDRLYADELVLRFCALYKSDKITKNLKDYLNFYMKEMVRKTKDNEKEIGELEVIFKRTVNLLNKLDEENLFWRKRGGFSASLYDGIMIGLARNIERYGNDNELLKDKIKELKSNNKFREEFSGSQSHNAKNVMGRLKIADKIFKKK